MSEDIAAYVRIFSKRQRNNFPWELHWEKTELKRGLLRDWINRQTRSRTGAVDVWCNSFRGTQREYSSKTLKPSIIKRILVFKR